VDYAGQENNFSSSECTNAITGNTLRWIHEGLECNAEQSNSHRRTLVRTGGIPSHQLLGAFLAMKAFGKTWQGITVLLCLDNVTAVTYINQKGGTTSSQLCHLAISMWMWCMEKNITLVAEHLPGHLNVIADQESRSMRDCCDWMLNPKVFWTIQDAMGPLEVDLFATRLTKQLPRFYNWRAHPEAAFLQDWSQLRDLPIHPGV